MPLMRALEQAVMPNITTANSNKTPGRSCLRRTFILLMIARPFADAAVCGDNGEENYKAIVTDPLMWRYDSDSRSHGCAHRR
jgi:hypothetical protein